jgi:predicted RNase H-like HicB family nuclease
MKYEYPIQVAWSPEDEAYIAMAMQLDGCIADGASPEEAITNLRTIIQEWIEVAKEDGRIIPEPMSVLDIARQQHEAEAQFRKEVDSALRTVAAQVTEQVKRQAPEERLFAFFQRRVEPVESHRD